MARKIRVVIAKPGLDGHDRGAKIIARALRDAGMEVIYTGLHQTPEQIVETAIQEDADAVGISILSGAHMTLVPRILDGLKENGVDDVLVIVGGHDPGRRRRGAKGKGVAAVFTPGAPTSEIVDFLKREDPGLGPSAVLTTTRDAASAPLAPTWARERHLRRRRPHGHRQALRQQLERGEGREPGGVAGAFDRRRLGDDHSDLLAGLLDLAPARPRADLRQRERELLAGGFSTLPVSASVNVVPCWAAKRSRRAFCRYGYGLTAAPSPGCTSK